MRFEKVPKEAFIKDCKKYLGGLIVIDNGIQKFLNEKGYSEEKLTKYYEEIYENISIPTRSTSGSAGYDFKNPFTNLSFCTLPIFIPTGIRIFLDKDKILQIVPRSSSSKKGIMLANTIGIIDSDYVNADNEGDIIIALRNYDKEKQTYSTVIEQNEKIAQGIIIPFYTVENDNATGVRTGGFGSTDK